jgi:hypothetical protein
MMRFQRLLMNLAVMKDERLSSMASDARARMG